MISPIDNPQTLNLLISLDLNEFPENLFMLHYLENDKYLGYFSPEDGVSGLVCFSSADLAENFLRFADDNNASTKALTLDEARAIAKDPKRPKVEALLLADDPWKPKTLFVRSRQEI
ncbi:MAG: hypothetical protein NT018_14640 [Armatimonadetes bacterium]|nr:hypothetical protein [Armatimonadota bacterium]